MKKHQQAVVLSLFLVISVHFATAQCSFNLDVQVIQNSTCISSGIVQATLSGTDIDPQNVLISLSSAGGTIHQSSTMNGIQFTSLPPEEYTIVAKTVCKGSLSEVSKSQKVSVASMYDPMNASLGTNKLKSLSCKSTGMVSFNVSDGKAPYQITVKQMPAGYMGAADFALQSAGAFQVDSLAAGSYLFAVTDACGYNIDLSVSVDKTLSDFPANPFNDAYSTEGCKDAAVDYWGAWNEADLLYYWRDNRQKFYEVAFTVDGGSRNYMELQSYTNTFSLPESYRKLHEEGKRVEVWLRLKDSGCEQMVDELMLSAPAQNSIGADVSRTCTDYQYRFRISSPRALCPPYRWEVRNDADVLAGSGSNVADMNTYLTAGGLLYDMNYTLVITDSRGNQLTKTFRENTRLPYLDYWSPSHTDGCTDYSMYYALRDACLPLKRELFGADSVLIGSAKVTKANETIEHLEYGKEYIVAVTDSLGHVVSFHYSAEPKPHNVSADVYSYYCDSYRLRVYPQDLCNKYDWTLMNTDSTIVAQSEQSVNAWYSVIVPDLSYDSTYVLFFTDSVNKIYYKVEPKTRPNPTWYWFDDYADRRCADYRLDFRATNLLCYPYQWEVFNDKDSLIGSETDITENRTASIRLNYNQDYSIRLTDANGYVLERQYKLNVAGINYNYYTNTNVAAPCYKSESPYMGYMYISGSLDAGTRIRFVSGAQTPLHADTTLTEYTYYFYPFSTNFSTSEYAVIADGKYVFEVTDPCGTSRELTITFKNSTLEVRNFSYMKDEETDICQGITRVYPKGKMYESGNPTSTTFQLIETPNGSGAGSTIDGNDAASYFSLSVTGKYVIAVSRSQWDYCAFDTLVINHTRKTFGLDGRSSYVCEPGGAGHIRVQAKDGKEPYSYLLLDAGGNSVAAPNNPNNTGEFEFGAQGDTYTIRITDGCNKSFPLNVQVTTLDQMALINGNIKLCQGENIDLACLLIGATEYEWTGPAAFSSTDRIISIANAKPENAGNYTISVKPAGCNNFITESVPVEVRTAPVPQLQDTVYMCRTQTPYQLWATPDEGYSVLWYDENEQLLGASPLADLSILPEYVFYAAQKDNELACIGEKSKTVITKNVPESMIIKTTVPAAICQGDSLLFGNRYLTLADAYTDSLVSVATGCDSIVTLHLAVNQVKMLTISAQICVNDSIEFHGRYYHASGIYNDTLKTASGCDSIVSLQLTVSPVKSDTLPAVHICTGDSYEFHGKYYHSTGFYSDSLKTLMNCDSIVTLPLVVHSDTTIHILDSIYIDKPYNKHGFNLPVQHAAGDFTDTLFLQNQYHCDSTVVLHLNVSCFTQHTLLVKSICENESYYFKNEYLNLTGIYYDSLTAKNSCDSVVTLQLTVHQVKKDTVSITICQGGSYSFHGKLYNTTGFYNDTLKSAITNCDSVVTLHLVVKPSSTTVYYADICQNETYTGHGFTLPIQTVVGTSAHQQVHDCDTIILYLSVHPIKETLINDKICQNEPYHKNGFSLPEQAITGSFSKQLSLKTVHGCDSIIKLNLVVNPTYETTFYARIAIGELYTDNGFNIPASSGAGNFVHTRNLRTKQHCDSLIILHLLVYAEIFPDKFFTPNDDGVNDVWKIKNIEQSDYSRVIIYDRFGKILKEYEDGKFKPWDGKYMGKEMPSTDYWYLITLKDGRVYTGHFTLIRN